MSLNDVLNTIPLSTNEDENVEPLRREAFLHFLSGLLKLEPSERWTPRQAASHPFITGEPFSKTFLPPDSFKRNRILKAPQQAAHRPIPYPRHVPPICYPTGVGAHSYPHLDPRNYHNTQENILLPPQPALVRYRSDASTGARPPMIPPPTSVPYHRTTSQDKYTGNAISPPGGVPKHQHASPDVGEHWDPFFTQESNFFSTPFDTGCLSTSAPTHGYGYAQGIPPPTSYAYTPYRQQQWSTPPVSRQAESHHGSSWNRKESYKRRPRDRGRAIPKTNGSQANSNGFPSNSANSNGYPIPKPNGSTSNLNVPMNGYSIPKAHSYNSNGYRSNSRDREPSGSFNSNLNSNGYRSNSRSDREGSGSFNSNLNSNGYRSNSRSDREGSGGFNSNSLKSNSYTIPKSEFKSNSNSKSYRSSPRTQNIEREPLSDAFKRVSMED